MSIRKNTAILFYNKKGEVLLQLRDDIPTINWPNHWGCIGGGVEEGETLEEGLKREVKEEIEYDIEEYESIGMFPIRENREYHMFIGPLDTPVENITLHEGQEVRYINPQDAFTLPLTKGTRHLLHRYIERMKL